ncbi:RND family transporter [Massilia sp. Root335]|jgi:predicted RND superfamily exporter protein|uniref:efflux RND transporter permease subunit n=1 Tax=Massilia sp. Root335 TaxID=1736517 RepID=UPI0009E82633|nr:MMPL family transporter [Massilia sp. Root335]
MKRVLSWTSHYLTGVPDWVRKRKALVLLMLAAATAFFIVGMSKLQFDFTIERWLKQDDAAFVAYNQFHDQFGSDDGVVIVYRPKDGNVFSAASLKAVKGIRDELLNYHAKVKAGESSALDHVLKVDTLVNAPVLTVKQDAMVSHWLVGDTVPTAEPALAAIRRTAWSERDFVLKYFSKDEKYGAIYIKTDFGAIPINAGEASAAGQTVNMTVGDPQAKAGGAEEPLRFKPTDMADYVALNAALNEILARPEYAAHLEYYKVGNTIDSDNQVKMGKEMGLLYMVGLLIMLTTLFMIFRSFAGALWPAVIIVLSTIWTFGIAGWTGMSISPFVILTILLILTIGMADVTHMTSSYLYFRAEGHDTAAAIREAYEKAGLACFLTTITTIAGMLSLLSGSLVPVINFSLMSAIGVGVVFFLTMHLLPVLLDIWSPAPDPARRNTGLAALIARLTPNFVPALQRALDKIVPMVEQKPWAFITPFLLLFVASVWGALHVKVDYSVYDQYSKQSNFYQAIKLLDQKMAGSSQMSLYVDLGEDNGFQDPAVLRVIDDLQHKFEKDYGKYVVSTGSIVNVVKDAYQKQNDGRPDMYAIPSKREVLSQTLFTFNVANPEEREKLVSESYRKANITVTLRGYGSSEYTKVFERMKQDIHASLDLIRKDYPNARVSITGLFAMGMKAADYLVTNELQSFGLSLLVISGMLLVIFNSFKAGAVSLIPNVVPSFLVLGVLGWLNIPLDFYTMMLAPIAVGIAVDDTIHFVSVYRTEVLHDGDIRRALVDTVKECGQSTVFASMILGFGFGIMSVATTPGLASLGKLGFLAIFSGLVCELFLTPALILVFKLRFQAKQDEVAAPLAAAPQP